MSPPDEEGGPGRTGKRAQSDLQHSTERIRCGIEAATRFIAGDEIARLFAVCPDGRAREAAWNHLAATGELRRLRQRIAS